MRRKIERRAVRSKAEAKRFGEELAMKLSRSIPVNPKEIAERLGLKVLKAPDRPKGLSGALVVEADRAVILYNGGDHEQRWRFTVAHELGHYMMHTRPGQTKVLFRDDRSSRGTDLKEIQANAFAAALLMPEDTLRDRVKHPITSFNSAEIDDLAKDYLVSSQAMAYRLEDLGLYTPYL